MTTAEHVKIVNDVSLSQRPTLPAARDKAHASSASRDLFLVLFVRILYSIPRCFKPAMGYAFSNQIARFGRINSDTTGRTAGAGRWPSAAKPRLTLVGG